MNLALHGKSQKFILIASIMAITTIIFWPALHGGFIFDDYPIFAENTSIHVSGWKLAEWKSVWIWSQTNIQRPIAMLSYAFNYALGNSTFGFKMTNLCIHLLNAALVFLFVQHLLPAVWVKKHTADNSSKSSYWAAAIAAAWAMHPIQVSAVMYTVQRMELLGFAFTLFALLAYWRGRQLQLENSRSWPYFALSVALVIIGYGAKETVILTPGYALILELTILNFNAAKHKTSQILKVIFVAGIFCTSLGFAFYLIPHYANAFDGRDFTAWQRELTQLRVLPMYIGWLLAPFPNRLVFYYDNYPASVSLMHPITTLLGGGLLACLVVIAILLRRRRPLITIGIAWFFIAHALTSSPVPLELVFEHRNYPALLGIVLVLGDIFWLVSLRLKSAVPVVLGVLLIVNLCFLTTLRSIIWSSPWQLSMALAEYNPGSVRAAMDLARRYMAISKGNVDSPMYSMSIQELLRALKLPSDSPLPEEALLLSAPGYPGVSTDACWDSLQEKLRNRPLTPDTYQVLHQLADRRIAGVTTIDAGRLIEAIDIAAKRNPNRLSLQTDYAELLGGVLSEPDQAMAHWKIALQLDKDPSVYGAQLAKYLIGKERYQEAAGVTEITLELAPRTRQDAAFLTLRETALRALRNQASH